MFHVKVDTELQIIVFVFSEMGKSSQTPVNKLRSNIKCLKGPFLQMFSSLLLEKVNSSLKGILFRYTKKPHSLEMTFAMDGKAGYVDFVPS